MFIKEGTWKENKSDVLVTWKFCKLCGEKIEIPTDNFSQEYMFQDICNNCINKKENDHAV